MARTAIGAAAIAARLVVVVTRGFEEGIGVEVVGLFNILAASPAGDRVWVARSGHRQGPDGVTRSRPSWLIQRGSLATDVVPGPGLHVMDGKAQPLWLLVRGDAALGS